MPLRLLAWFLRGQVPLLVFGLLAAASSDDRKGGCS